jgi:hypothetical protein
MTAENTEGVESHFTPVDDQNENVDRTCAQLLVYPGDIHPSEVTRLLGIAPTRTVVAGERGPANRIGRAPIGKINGWFLSSEGSVRSKDLRRHLDWLIGELSQRWDALSTLQARQGVRMYVHCPWWSRHGGGGPTFWPAQLRGLADLNLECTVSFADYSDEATEGVETDD